MARAFVKDAVARGARRRAGRARRWRPRSRRWACASSPTKIRAPRLARLAAAFFGAQPDTVAAVTGTKGKSSIVAFLREIWTALGKPAASLGTVGVVGPEGRNAADAHHARSGGDPSTCWRS